MRGLVSQASAPKDHESWMRDAAVLTPSALHVRAFEPVAEVSEVIRADAQAEHFLDHRLWVGAGTNAFSIART
jgi:hypothetical protein